jgi:hypothetical protein
MKRRIAVLTVLVLATGGCSSRTPVTAVTETTGASSPNESASGESPVEGGWDTGPYPAEQARAAIIAAGHSEASADEAVGGKRRFECTFVFYEEGGVPYVSTACWDPSKISMPTDSDHGPYQLLPNDRLKITCDVCEIDTEYNLFSYELGARTLTLLFIRTVDPGLKRRSFATRPPSKSP